MKTIAVFILCLLVIVTPAITQSRERNAFPRRSSGPDIDIARLEKKIHVLINKERTKRGLSALSWNESLHRVARKYSKVMAEQNFLSHDGPDGNSFCDRYKAEGFKCSIRVGGSICLGAENIAQDNLYSSCLYRNGKKFYDWCTEEQIAGSVVKGWMSSNGHRANILTPYFKRQGIGVALSDDGKVYVTQNFC